MKIKTLKRIITSYILVFFSPSAIRHHIPNIRIVNTKNTIRKRGRTAKRRSIVILGTIFRRRAPAKKVIKTIIKVNDLGTRAVIPNYRIVPVPVAEPIVKSDINFYKADYDFNSNM